MKRMNFVKVILLSLFCGISLSLVNAEDIGSAVNSEFPGHYYTSNDISNRLPLLNSNFIQVNQEVTIFLDDPDLKSFKWSLLTPQAVLSVTSNEPRREIFFTVGNYAPSVVTFSFVLDYGNGEQTMICNFRVRNKVD